MSQWNPFKETSGGSERAYSSTRPLIASFPSRRRASRQQPATRDYVLGRISIPLVSVVSATEAAAAIAARNMSRTTVLFSVPRERDDFSHVNLWVKGYQGNLNFVEMGKYTVSPAVLLLEPSAETLTLALQTETVDGLKSDVEKSPTVVVVNDA